MGTPALSGTASPSVATSTPCVDIRPWAETADERQASPSRVAAGAMNGRDERMEGFLSFAELEEVPSILGATPDLGHRTFVQVRARRCVLRCPNVHAAGRCARPAA